MFKTKLLKPEQGFSMVEVLVAILIATIFVTATMQVMALATVFRVRAQEYAEATTWIQEDLENVKEQASQVGIANVQNMIPDDAATAGTDESLITITTTSKANDFPDGEKIVFLGDGIADPLRINETYYIINSTRDDLTKTNTFKVSATEGGTAIPLTTNSSGSLIAAAVKRCDSTVAVNRNTGYGDKLRDWISDTNHDNGITDITNDNNDFDNPPSSGNAQTAGDDLKSKLFTEKEFKLTRTTTTINTAPYNRLQLDYTVLPVGSTTSIASFHTEVIPNAALQCP